MVQTAPCRRFDTIPCVWQTDGQTDRQTDGIAVASTALAMRALRRAVKSSPLRPCGWSGPLPACYRLQVVAPSQLKIDKPIVAWHDNCRKWCSDAAHDARRVTYNCSVLVYKAMASVWVMLHNAHASQSPQSNTAPRPVAVNWYLLTVRRRWTI